MISPEYFNVAPRTRIHVIAIDWIRDWKRKTLCNAPGGQLPILRFTNQMVFSY